MIPFLPSFPSHEKKECFVYFTLSSLALVYFNHPLTLIHFFFEIIVVPSRKHFKDV